MRILPIDIEFELWSYGNTIQFSIMHFDTHRHDYYLIGCGWYQGDFWFELCFWSQIKKWFTGDK